MNIKHIFQSKTFTRTLYGISIAIAGLLIFQAGIMVGYRKASYSHRFGENYYRTFGKPGELSGGHGAVGKIIKLEPPTIIIEGPDDTEKIITVGDSTTIKRFRDTIAVTDLKLDERVVVIGAPNDTGTIDARLIRVMPKDSPPPFFIKKQER